MMRMICGVDLVVLKELAWHTVYRIVSFWITMVNNQCSHKSNPYTLLNSQSKESVLLALNSYIGPHVQHTAIHHCGEFFDDL